MLNRMLKIICRDNKYAGDLDIGIPIEKENRLNYIKNL